MTKILGNLEGLLHNSVLIETHTDRDEGTAHAKPYIKQFYVLMSALRDKEDIIPVQFEIMEYRDDNNKLYVVVAMTKIKEVDVTGNTIPVEQEQTNLLSTSIYSIRNIFRNINPKDKLFLKYVPDEFEEFVKANENLMQKAFRLIRELVEDLQHFMEDWRKELPGMFKMLQKSKWYECMICLVAGKLKLDCPLLFA